MDERLRCVARLLEGEKMAPLCAEFGVSRKTGYKIFERCKDCGVRVFSDRSRRPFRQATGTRGRGQRSRMASGARTTRANSRPAIGGTAVC